MFMLAVTRRFIYTAFSSKNHSDHFLIKDVSPEGTQVSTNPLASPKNGEFDGRY